MHKGNDWLNFPKPTIGQGVVWKVHIDEGISILQAQANEYPCRGTGPAVDTQASPCPEVLLQPALWEGGRKEENPLSSFIQPS